MGFIEYYGHNHFKGYCRTKSGPNPRKRCIFPFHFNGKTYNGCAKHPKDNNNELWCSTKVDRNGNHVVGQNQYGYCNKFCPSDNSGSGGTQQHKSQHHNSYQQQQHQTHQSLIQSKAILFYKSHY